MIYDLQKASMWKRASAALFDFIILVMVIVGLATLLSNIFGYDKYNKTLNAAYEKYTNIYETQYGVDFGVTEEQYNAYTEEEKALWQKAYEEANDALSKAPEAGYAFNMLFNLSLLIVTFSVLFAYLILEFIIPLFFKNGQTLGKKIFGIGVMRVDGVKVVGPLMFIRTALGKFTIETMIPVIIVVMIFFNGIGIIGPIIIGLILLVQVYLLITTNTNSMIHDVLAKTVVIDVASQMIFDSEEALIAYKTKVHAEAANRQTY